MAAREQTRKLRILQAAVRLVVALALLVLHDTALLIELLLVHRIDEMAHAVTLEPQDLVERGLRHRLEVIGAVKPGRTIEIGCTDRLHGLDPLTLEILCALEHQMLEQMGKAGAAGTLVLRADMVPDAHRNHRRLLVGRDDHPQAIGQCELFERNIDIDVGCAQWRRGGLGFRCCLGLSHGCRGRLLFGIRHWHGERRGKDQCANAKHELACQTHGRTHGRKDELRRAENLRAGNSHDVSLGRTGQARGFISPVAQPSLNFDMV